MSCTQYEKYDFGQISSEEFEQHLKDCSFCQQEIAKDERIMDAAASLNDKKTIPSLWPEIEKKLQKKHFHFRIPQIPGHLIKIAATILIGISMVIFFGPETDLDQYSILSESALQEVEQQEQAYVQSIERLERIATKKMESFDLNLALLYRDKLETIDSQIESCQDALENNPANTHIRRYLLAALDDKKQTLKEILR